MTTNLTVTPRIKYITNKDLLAEIKVCKATFCSFTKPEYINYDKIALLEEITPDFLSETIKEKAAKMSTKAVPVDPASIQRDSIVFRVMTDAHLPEMDSKKRRLLVNGSHIRTNFNPFRHFILQGDQLVEVGRSHWKGSFTEGSYCVDHGRISNRLASMFILLVEQYSRGGSWRGYCYDESTEALTQRGWLTMDEITESDIILAYDQADGALKWSSIKGIFRDDYDGLMFHLTVAGMDALVTPGHKFITQDGLKEAELLTEKDRLILMGSPVPDGSGEGLGEYEDAFVELVGWTVTEGSYYAGKNKNLINVSIFQNEGPKADRIRKCLNDLGVRFSEFAKLQYTGNTLIRFYLMGDIRAKLLTVAPNRVMTMEFMLSLTETQRELLIQTMVDGDGWTTKAYGNNYKGGYRRFCQKNKAQLDAFLALCTMNGHRTTHRWRPMVSFGKPTSIWEVNVFSKTYDRHRCSMVENVDMHGAKRNGRAHPGRGKQAHPNVPTVPYKGQVWCPQTEYGTVVVRRNGTIFAASNTYVDEMRSHAMVQLAQVGLQFDESRGDNPFAFYTQTIKNSFRRTLNVERKSQSVRDDLLIMAGVMPSYTRQVDNEMEQRNYYNNEKTGRMIPAKRGRKPKAE